MTSLPLGVNLPTTVWAAFKDQNAVVALDLSPSGKAWLRIGPYNDTPKAGDVMTWDPKDDLRMELSDEQVLMIVQWAAARKSP